jgi:hypothetical protein
MYVTVWGEMAFRVEDVGNKSIVLNPDGLPLESFSLTSATVGQTPLLHGLRERSLPPGSETFDMTVALNDPSVKTALSHDEFISQALVALQIAGAPLGEKMNLEPPSGARWDTATAQPQQ